LRAIAGWARRHPFKALSLLLLLFILVQIFWPGAAPEYRSSLVTRGPVERTVTAAGRLMPLRTIRVGAETSGLVTEVLVDVNQRVEQGQLLAVIEPDRLAAGVSQAQSTVSAARAAIEQAEAMIARSRADTIRFAAEHGRLQALHARGFVSRRSLEVAQADMLRARADERAAVAQSSSARSNLSRAEAQLADTRTAFARSRIVAPMAGIVVSRQVDPGQTLATSFQTPVLFEIVDDLRSMQLQANVSEADIGAVALGQPARISIDALGENVLSGRVRQVRPQPTDDNGAITYQVIIDLGRVPARLLPGMSATVDIVVSRAPRSMRVPAASLSYRPPATDGSILPRVESFRVTASPSRGGGGPPVKATREVVQTEAPDDGQPAVWRLDDRAPRGLVRVRVRVGIRGDDMVEIVGGDLQVGDRVAVGGAT